MTFICTLCAPSWVETPKRNSYAKAPLALFSSSSLRLKTITDLKDVAALEMVLRTSLEREQCVKVRVREQSHPPLIFLNSSTWQQASS